MATESVLWTALPERVSAKAGELPRRHRVRLAAPVDRRRAVRCRSRSSRRSPTGRRRSASSSSSSRSRASGTFDTDADPDRSRSPTRRRGSCVFGGDVGVDRPRSSGTCRRRRIRIFPAAEVADHVLDLYTDVAERLSADQFPPVTFGPLGDARRRPRPSRRRPRRTSTSGSTRCSTHETSQLVEDRSAAATSPRARAARRAAAASRSRRPTASTTGSGTGRASASPAGTIDPAKVPPPPKRRRVRLPRLRRRARRLPASCCGRSGWRST